MAALSSSEIPHGIIVGSVTSNALTHEQATSSQEYHKALSCGNSTMESSDGAQQPEEGDAQEKLQTFWPRQMEEIQNLTNNEFKTQELPLARIKKIMKMDEDVKMISAEAPLLFSKAAQIFITELSLRAWVHTEESKRRTLQRNDIATAITKFDQFDFLIDIVPREELKPLKRTYSSGGSSEVQQYFYAIPSQQQQQASSAATNPSVNTGVQAVQQGSALQSGQLLIAQQNQNGQPMTLTPVNTDSTPVLQLAPSSQVQSAQQTQAVVLNSSSGSTGQVVVQAQTHQQQTNEQKQQQQSVQAVLQQLVGNTTSAQGEIHSIQMNAQGQLQLVKVVNPQQQQAQSQPGAAAPVRQVAEAANQMYSMASGGDTSAAQSTAAINAIYVNPAE